MQILKANTGQCATCHRPLNQPDDRTTEDCGGDCLKCMADACDPDCRAAMVRLGHLEYENHD